MARIRSIKPEFWTSEQVVECSRDARLLFVGLWNFCDDHGIHPVSIRRIKMEVFPADDIDSSSIRRMLSELSSNGLIVFYTTDEQEYLYVTGWEKHQRIDKPTYKYPVPTPEQLASARRTLVERSVTEWSGEDRSGVDIPFKEEIPLKLVNTTVGEGGV